MINMAKQATIKVNFKLGSRWVEPDGSTCEGCGDILISKYCQIHAITWCEGKGKESRNDLGKLCRSCGEEFIKQQRKRK